MHARWPEPSHVPAACTSGRLIMTFDSVCASWHRSGRGLVRLACMSCYIERDRFRTISARSGYTGRKACRFA